MTGDSTPPRPSSLAPGPLIEVAAGLVFRGGKLLITRRHAEAHQGGLWEFPGGKRELRETMAACLIRELREELGIEVEVGRILESVSHAYPEKAVRIEFFLCRWRRNEPQTLGCAAFKWITAAELPAYEFPAADAQLINRLQNSAELWG